DLECSLAFTRLSNGQLCYHAWFDGSLEGLSDCLRSDYFHLLSLFLQDVNAAQFVIEYCGEVISWKEAKRRSQVYEAEGVKESRRYNTKHHFLK
ncbi:hypothetical protein Taro_029805, partial [Colocasia esculenta]|nr:hypothetical protein [Colocasia esculenta]